MQDQRCLELFQLNVRMSLLVCHDHNVAFLFVHGGWFPQIACWNKSRKFGRNFGDESSDLAQLDVYKMICKAGAGFEHAWFHL